jgi:hypothetical protein
MKVQFLQNEINDIEQTMVSIVCLICFFDLLRCFFYWKHAMKEELSTLCLFLINVKN